MASQLEEDMLPSKGLTSSLGRAMGGQLPYPHSSAVKGADRLRELRPRAGRSPWRAFYRCIGDVAVIGGFGPEARADPRGFRAAVQRAMDRLAAYEAGKG